MRQKDENAIIKALRKLSKLSNRLDAFSKQQYLTSHEQLIALPLKILPIKLKEEAAIKVSSRDCLSCRQTS
ncbi:CLUMA_CG019250, isoform A [Clunio marinus]|uniref:CLUMA_CG019250, isoform A n=1 Tax=Clunio marinus TaxID=568069 RepID=A0A1J1J5M7_9DIPT|nr:CLUMA_CG019250, isoform A [Clunio marinus]